MYKNLIRHKVILIGILFLALTLRLYGIAWDQGYHLHPDERMLILVAQDIAIPDQLDPDFFNYGSLPIYVLRGVSQLTGQASYDGMLGIGRMLSAIVDILTLIFVIKLARLITKKESAALFAGFVYAVSVFPIQNSHFFVVDVFLTLFVTVSLYLSLSYITRPKFSTLLWLGIATAGAVTSKFTGIVIVPIIGLFILISKLYNHNIYEKIVTIFTNTAMSLGVWLGVFVISAFVFMPYGFLDYQQFMSEISLQTKMSSDPFIFPYTLQYVGTTPYLYFLKNIFLWGLGPIIALLAFTGGVLLAKDYIVSPNLTKSHNPQKALSLFGITLRLSSGQIITILMFLFYLWYFLLLGRSAVKFMRYMLPLYPFFALMGGYLLYYLTSYNKSLVRIVGYITILLSCVWTAFFVNIYSSSHTRFAASEWIYSQVPVGSTIAVEHWDDRLPLILPGERPDIFSYEELELYNPDSNEKWSQINEQLDRSDYIIIASNRLYTPLSRLTECGILPEHRCYPETSTYYQDLFDEQLGFSKVAEFTSYPRLTLGPWTVEINDTPADESFTVYDHPTVMIFKKQ